MSDVKPYGARVAVTDVPLDDNVKASGLIVISDQIHVSIGVIVRTTMDMASDQLDETATIINVMTGQQLQLLKPGMLVYYHKGAGIQIRDVRIIAMNDIIAYEEA